MLDIPKWLINILPNIKCCVCNKRSMVPENVIAIGVRKSGKNMKKTVFFFDYACACGKNSIIEFPDQMNVEGFVNMMVDEYIPDGEEECEHDDNCPNHPKNLINKGPKENIDPQKIIKSKISMKEVEELKKILDSPDYPSFLSQIGVPQELINGKKLPKKSK